MVSRHPRHAELEIFATVLGHDRAGLGTLAFLTDRFEAYAISDLCVLIAGLFIFGEATGSEDLAIVKRCESVLHFGLNVLLVLLGLRFNLLLEEADACICPLLLIP